MTFDRDHVFVHVFFLGCLPLEIPGGTPAGAVPGAAKPAPNPGQGSQGTMTSRFHGALGPWGPLTSIFFGEPPARTGIQDQLRKIRYRIT